MNLQSKFGYCIFTQTLNIPLCEQGEIMGRQIDRPMILLLDAPDLLGQGHKKNFDEQKKKIVLIYYFLMNGTQWWCLISMYLQTSTLWEKYKESIKEVQH